MPTSLLSKVCTSGCQYCMSGHHYPLSTISSIANKTRSRFSSTVFFSTAPLHMTDMQSTNVLSHSGCRSKSPRAPQQQCNRLIEGHKDCMQYQLIFILGPSDIEHQVSYELVADNHLIKHCDFSCNTGGPLLLFQGSTAYQNCKFVPSPLALVLLVLENTDFS